LSSFRLVWCHALRESGLDAKAKLVGFALSTYMDGGGLAWPSRTTIAAASSLSVRSVDQALSSLKASGFSRSPKVRVVELGRTAMPL
jgi:hypothetical protein